MSSILHLRNEHRHNIGLRRPQKTKHLRFLHGYHPPEIKHLERNSNTNTNTNGRISVVD